MWLYTCSLVLFLYVWAVSICTKIITRERERERERRERERERSERGYVTIRDPYMPYRPILGVDLLLKAY